MANKKKKQNTHASGSGSIISNYFESQDKLYERDMQGQKIASETRAKADSYYGEDKKYSDTDYTNQSESRYRRLAEKAVEIKERTHKNSEKYKRTNTLIRNAAKAENNMLSEIPRREQREKQEQQSFQRPQRLPMHGLWVMPTVRTRKISQLRLSWRIPDQAVSMQLRSQKRFLMHIISKRGRKDISVLVA